MDNFFIFFVVVAVLFLLIVGVVVIALIYRLSRRYSHPTVASPPHDSPSPQPGSTLPSASFSPGLPHPQEDLRLDSAVPNKVAVNKIFDLAVSVRRKDSPILQEDDLPKVKSGGVQLSWPESQYCIHLRVHINAPDCDIHGKDSQFFCLYRDSDSPTFYFQLSPQREGKLSIVVTVYQEDEWLGSTRTYTMAFKDVVGQVQLDVISNQMNSIVYSSLRQQILNLTRRLQKLKEMKAMKGINTEPYHLMEIEDIEIELSSLQRALSNY